MSKATTQSYIFIVILALNALPIVSAQSDKSITIYQELEFNASPEQLYEALLDSKQFAEFLGIPAEINREVGGAFSLFNGHIIGRNLELVPNQRIVPSVASGHMARRRVFHREIRAEAARIGNVPRV